MNREVKRILVIIGLLGLWIFLVQNIDLARAKDPEYPTKPIDFIISMSPGGTSDISARALANAASKHLGQPFIPINKTGGGGTIGAMVIMNAKPDGYTLGPITISPAFVSPFSEGAPYKDLTGFTWIMNYGSPTLLLAVKGDAPWRSWKELIEWARKNPRALKIGITGAKKADYKGLTLSQIEKKEQVEFTFLTFKGNAEVLTATLGGHIDLYGAGADPTFMEYVKEGKMRILSYTSTVKVPGYEDVPSTTEMYGVGVPDLAAIIGPKGLPNYVIIKLEDAFTKAIKDPDFIKIMNITLSPIVYMNRATLMKHVEETFSKTAEIYGKVKAEEEKEKK